MFLHWCLHIWVRYDYLDLSSLGRGFFLLWVFWRVWWLCATCLPGLLCCCVSRECLLVLEARILGLLGWRKAEGEGLCGPLGWCQREKGDYSSFSATELGMRLGEWGETKGTKWEVWISLHPTCCSRRRGHCLCKGWGMGSHTECGGKAVRGRSVGSTKDENRGQGRLPHVFCCRTEYETRGLILWEQREKRKPAGKIPGFLAGQLLYF